MGVPGFVAVLLNLNNKKNRDLSWAHIFQRTATTAKRTTTIINHLCIFIKTTSTTATTITQIENFSQQRSFANFLIFTGVPREDNPIRCLYECLVAVGRRDLAEIIRKKINEMNPAIADSKTAKCSLM